MRHIFHALTVGAAALALVSCGDTAEPEAESATDEAMVAEPAVEEVAEEDGATEAFEVCDGEGNRYPSEQAARDAGLSEAEYGATYCDYIDEE